MNAPRPTRSAALASFFVGAASAALLVVRLMIPQPVGVADSYDGARLMCHFGIDMHLPNGAARLHDYVTFRYDRMPGTSCAEHAIDQVTLRTFPYRSSQLLVLYTGRWFTRLLGFNGFLDLRAVGLVCCLLIGGALGLLFWVMTCRYRFRLLLCGLLLSVTADSAFIDFAVSPLSEIAGTIGVLYTLPATVLLFQPGRRGLAGLVLLTVAGTFLVLAKEQDAVLVLPLAALLLAVRAPIRHGRALSVAAVATLVVCAFTLTAQGDPWARQIVKANFVTATLLATDTHPSADLRELGAPAWLARIRGMPMWCAPSGTMMSPSYVRFLYGVSYQQIATLLVHHPGQIPRILSLVADGFYQPRPEYTLCPARTGGRTTMLLADYARESGLRPRSVDHRFTPVISALAPLSGSGFVPLFVLWTVPPAACALAMLRHRRQKASESVVQLAAMSCYLVGIAVIQFVVCAFGDGIDTPKHLNLSIFTTAASWAVGTAAVALACAGTAASAGFSGNANRLHPQSRNDVSGVSPTRVSPPR